MRIAGSFLMLLLVPALAAAGAGLFPSAGAGSTLRSPLATEDLPRYLRDRGTGVATSLFGTYVRKGELLVYPFYECTYDKNAEYKPSELGFAGDQDYRGKLTEHEALIFLSYGVSESVILELESALWTTATQRKAVDDTSAVPARLKESGFGDTQAEIRWRWWKESARRPEIWSYFEAVFPFQKNRVLIGTQDWELVQGLGVTRGFGWGTLTARVSASYTAEEKAFAFGEYAVEYLRKLSPKSRLVLSLEGEEDEVAAIAEFQLRVGPRGLLKLNNGFGITSKAPDIAPEAGVTFSF